MRHTQLPNQLLALWGLLGPAALFGLYVHVIYRLDPQPDGGHGQQPVPVHVESAGFHIDHHPPGQSRLGPGQCRADRIAQAVHVLRGEGGAHEALVALAEAGGVGVGVAAGVAVAAITGETAARAATVGVLVGTAGGWVGWPRVAWGRRSGVGDAGRAAGPKA